MKVRNLEELQNQIDCDIAWRSREISEFDMLIQSTSNHNYLPRAFIVMLCAHFEGSIRFSSNAYVAYISGQNLKGSDLRLEISSIAVRKKKHQSFNHTGSKKIKITLVSDVLQMYDELLNSKFFIKISEDDLFPEVDDSDPALPTEGNPTPEVLKEISKILGLNYDALFGLREPFINSELLDLRHQVAHGERRPITLSEIREAKNFVLTSIGKYADAIMDAAGRGYHLRNSTLTSGVQN